jgi:hypothetical protein
MKGQVEAGIGLILDKRSRSLICECILRVKLLLSEMNEAKSAVVADFMNVMMNEDVKYLYRWVDRAP